MLQPISTVPLSYSLLIKRSLNLYRYAFKRTYILGLILAIIFFIPHILSILSNRPELLTPSLFSLDTLWLIAMNLCAFLFLSAMLWRVNCLERNKHETLIEDFKTAFNKLLTIIASILLQICIFIAVGLTAFAIQTPLVALLHSQFLSEGANLTTFLIVPLFSIQFLLLIFLSILFYFYLPLIVVENDGIVLSLKQSVRLVWGNVLRVLAVQLTPWLVYVLVLILIKTVLPINIQIALFGLVSHPSLITTGGTAVQIFIASLFLPWIVSIILVQLRDLELRKARLSRP